MVIPMKSFIKCLAYLAVIGLLFFFLGRIAPKKWFRYDKFPYRSLGFEKDGSVYQTIGVRKWKNKFPDMSIILPKLIPSKKMPATVDTAHMELMIQETCIAEWTHVSLGILGLGCVFLWKSIGGWIMAALYMLGNIPYILIQRHNRPKLVRILCRLQDRDKAYARNETEYINEEAGHSEL